MDRVFYRDSTGMEIVVKGDGLVHVSTPSPIHIFNAAHLAALISGLVHAHQEIANQERGEQKQ